MLSKKLSSITPSYTIGISTKVSEMKKAGREIINLSIGEPDFPAPECAKAGVIAAVKSDRSKYDAAAGLVELREAICDKLLKENRLHYTVDEIVVSSGAKHAITNALIAITDPGDEILIPKPYWVSYPEMVKLTGGVPVFIDTHESHNYKVTVTDLERHFTTRTKALLINNPSNPSGAVYTESELRSIAEYCVAKNIVILADEIYETICYTDQFTAIASLSESIRDITITINGFSKSAAMTGWRLGYTACPKPVAKAIGSIQGHLVSHPSTLSQWGALAALKEGHADVVRMVKSYRERRDICVDLLSHIDGLKFIQPDGAFYIFMDLSFLKAKIAYTDSFSLAVTDALLDEYNLAVVPGIAFGMDDFIRISYATDIEAVKEGLKRLAAFCHSAVTK